MDSYFLYALGTGMYLTLTHFGVSRGEWHTLWMKIGIFVVGGFLGMYVGSLLGGFVFAVVFSFLFW